MNASEIGKCQNTVEKEKIAKEMALVSKKAARERAASPYEQKPPLVPSTNYCTHN